MREKIILGTVQLGIPYGINNASGKPSEKQAFDILDLAYAQGITTLDSADVYGDALRVIGQYKENTGREFSLINKFKQGGSSLLEKFEENLRVLQYASLSCYMYHSFEDYQVGFARAELSLLKERGKIKSIGVSLYSEEQLEQAATDPMIDVIQLPCNLFDFTPEKKILLKRAKDNKKEIHARSIYLQGLLLKDPDTLTGNLVPFREPLQELNAIATSFSLDIKEIALNYVLRHDLIDRVVLGVDRANQLSENIKMIRPVNDDLLKAVDGIHLDPQLVLNPANWKP